MRIISREFLPTTTPSVHAASIAFYKNHPVFSWFGGTREGMPDVAIYLHNLNNDNTNIVIGDKDIIPRWNPILVNIGNKLILFEKAGKFCDCWQTFVHDISDWTNDITRKEINGNAFILPAGLNGPVKSCPLVVRNKLICGSSVETYCNWTSYIEEYETDDLPNRLKFINRSEPLTVAKKTYQDNRSGKTSKTMGIIQPALFVTNGPIKGDEDYNGSIYHAFFRSSRGLDKIYYSRNYIDDKDACFWIDPIPTNLDNPNSAADVVFYKDRLFLVHNPSKDYRYPLVLSEIEIEYDGENVNCGVIDQIIIAEKVPENKTCISRELSYPYIIEHDGKLHLAYTVGRVAIEYCIVEI